MAVRQWETENAQYVKHVGLSVVNSEWRVVNWNADASEAHQYELVKGYGRAVFPFFQTEGDRFGEGYVVNPFTDQVGVVLASRVVEWWKKDELALKYGVTIQA